MTRHKSPRPAAEPKPVEAKKSDAALDDKQLETVSGGTGNLYNACCTGKHIPTGKLTV